MSFTPRSLGRFWFLPCKWQRSYQAFVETVLRAGMSEPLSSYLPEPVGRAKLKQPPGEMPVYLCCCWKTHSNFCPNKRL